MYNSTNATLQRLHYLDSLRGMLMVLGVIYHAALVYTRSVPWAIKDPEANSLFYSLVSYISHTFRMPCFFIISGYFCYFTMTKTGALGTLKLRIPRLFVPLVISIVTLTTVKGCIVYIHNGGTDGFWGQFLPNNYYYFFTYSNAFSHLWFLNNLILYFIIFSTAWPLTRKVVKKTETSSTARHLFFGWPLLIWLTGAAYLCSAIDNYYNLHGLLIYLPFFFWGNFLCANKDIFESFQRISTIMIGTTAAALLLGIYVRMENIEHSLPRAFSDLLLSYASISMSAISFSLFRKLLSQKNRTLSIFASASYSIYLFHYPLVVYLGALLTQTNLNVHAKFSLLVGSTTLIALGIHYLLIERFPILKFAFNGAKPKQK